MVRGLGLPALPLATVVFLPLAVSIAVTFPLGASVTDVPAHLMSLLI